MEVSFRVLVGVIIVKLFVFFLDNFLNEKFFGVLIDICYIFRSKFVEFCDMVRDMFVKIFGVFGVYRFGFILKELCGVFVRGNQFYILFYIMYFLLLVVILVFEQGDFDYCLFQIMVVIMDDIFGVIG